jgi:hypothetical protein
MKLTAIILGLFAVSSITSCRVQTSPPESATADVIGLVALDSGGISPTPSGVTVSLEGTNFSAITDDSGRFEFNNVQSGTYTVNWSKPGYGDVRYIGAAIQGGGNTPVYIAQPYLSGVYGTFTTDMRAFSHLAVNVQSASFSPIKNYADTFLVLDGSYTDDEYVVNYVDDITIFFSHKQDVSPIEGHYDGFVSGTAASDDFGSLFDTINHTFHCNCDEGFVMNGNFHSGDSLYIAVYGTVYPESIYGDYFDPAYNEEVMTSYNQTPSRVIGLKIP